MATKLPEPNPFIASLSIPILWKLTTSGTTGNWANGRLYNVKALEVDNRTTLYTDNLLPLFQQLTASAKDMVLYIAKHLTHNQDYVELREDRYCQEMGISRNTYSAAKAQLINRIIIPRTSRKYTYWINPSMLYKGSRLRKYPDLVVPVNEHPFHRMAVEEDSDPIQGTYNETETPQ